MDKLQDAMEKNDFSEVNRLMRDVQEAYHGLKPRRDDQVPKIGIDDYLGDQNAIRSGLEEVVFINDARLEAGSIDPFSIQTASSTQHDLAAQEHVEHTYMQKGISSQSIQTASSTQHELAAGSVDTFSIQTASSIQHSLVAGSIDPCSIQTASSTQHDLAAQDYVDHTYMQKETSSIDTGVDSPAKPDKFRLGRDTLSDGRAVWQVLQYEGLLGQLHDAMERKDAPAVHKIMHSVRAAYKKLKTIRGAEAFLERGRYNLAARESMSEVYSSHFSPGDAAVKARAQGSTELPCEETALGKPAGLKPLKDMLEGEKSKRVARSRTVLQLRGGGIADCGYGSCCTGPVSCGMPVLQASRADSGNQRKQKRTERPRPPRSPVVVINAFLDRIDISFGLISIDLGCEILNMIGNNEAWVTWLSDTVLFLMVLQQVLEICLNSGLAEKEFEMGEVVWAKVSCWADNGHNRPVRIEAGWLGTIDAIGAAKWRDDRGAFMTFAEHEEPMHTHFGACFVAQTDWVDFQVTSGAYAYWTNIMNWFNILVMAMCVFMAFEHIKHGAGVLIILRFLKPVFKMYSRSQKVREFHEKASEHFGGEEGEDGEELIGPPELTAEAVSPRKKESSLEKGASEPDGVTSVTRWQI